MTILSQYLGKARLGIMEIICRIHDTKLVIERKIQRIGRIVRSKIGSKILDNPEDISDIINIDIEELTGDAIQCKSSNKVIGTCSAHLYFLSNSYILG